ncbi:MAG: hypothetical protein NZM12_10695 [Steroidobacteraceae bacterium]|nr:hypothetical protein [Steroidobacteraceae bacterium]MDW8258201.1 hypothetical protein [Gammaproteobacteria bacterium]
MKSAWITGVASLALSAAAAAQDAGNARSTAKPNNVIEGPGYRIERRAGSAPPRRESYTPTRTLGGELVGKAVLCGAGERLLLQNLRLTATATGVVAQRGCELRIVDSEIRANGAALIVQAGARVDIASSLLAGRTASLDAAPGAQVAAWSVSFLGAATRDGVEFVDRGGNTWGSSP